MFARDELFRRDAVGHIRIRAYEGKSPLICIPPRGEAVGRGGWSPRPPPPHLGLHRPRIPRQWRLCARSRHFCSVSPLRISCFLHRGWLRIGASAACPPTGSGCATAPVRALSGECIARLARLCAFVILNLVISIFKKEMRQNRTSITRG